MSNHAEGPASFNDALSEGLSSSSDWSARVAAFNYLRSLLQPGQRGIQEVIQNFEKVTKMFFQHLDNLHHKIAQAALSTLADIIPSCHKPLESYMERIPPHVFSQLVDPEDAILKFWLLKLTPLVHDKYTKLKEAAVACIISVYSHFDPTSFLNFILSLSVEEQNSLRRALKQSIPGIEVDLMNFMQNKKERQRKSSYDPSDAVGTSSEEGYVSASKKSFLWEVFYWFS
ncbi:hypothetical protein RchiOBHm_Chr1g0330781 [Rosa chinensis]|uniref:CLASP domain-containing protein n=1 Tax=Rosa chinensis TaxID=74649 RepID=A0A2P6SBB8_ROSCH|nr:hypothetical protein RchiOBHm_Chr1g0330781 [Rosa chinensis]